MCFQLLFTVEVHSIVELSELENHLHHLRLVLARQTVVALSLENSLDTLIDELGAEGVETLVKSPVKGSLLRQNQNGLVISLGLLAA